jgi:AraC-like DNA-binding protein
LTFQKGEGILRAGFLFSPDRHLRYAGIAFDPVDEGMRDVSGTTALRIHYRTRTNTPLILQIMLDLAGHTHPGDYQSQRCLMADLPPHTDWTELSIPLSEFKTPPWWYQGNHLSPSSPDRPDLSRFLSLGLGDAGVAPAGVPQEIEIRSLSFEGSWAPSFWIAALLPLPGLSFLVWQSRRRSPGVTAVISPLGYPLDIQNQEETDFRRIVSFIASHYSDPDLSLSMINKETGIAGVRISSILEKRTGLRFKPYLNEVRIEEAARLLAETDRTVTEIAFLVGYGNTTHFNRVFRSLKQVVAGEFRRASRAKPADR